MAVLISGAVLGLDGPALATVRWGTVTEHWVAVLEADPARVILGDPVRGLLALPWDVFESEWGGELVVLERGADVRPGALTGG